MAYTCVIAECGCERATNCKCFSCGHPVCKSCSDVVDYHNYGKKRLCLSCQEEEYRAKEITVRIFRKDKKKEKLKSMEKARWEDEKVAKWIFCKNFILNHKDLLSNDTRFKNELRKMIEG